LSLQRNKEIIQGNINPEGYQLPYIPHLQTIQLFTHHSW